MSRTSVAITLAALLVPTLLDAQGAPGPRAAWLASAEHAVEDRVDPVAKLLQRIESGEVALEPEPVYGYLRPLLQALDIPLSSQSMVFSRTSLQVDLIAPWSPRAIYFNDDVYVGYVVDGFALEIASVDPDGGSVFYTLDQYELRRADLRRDDLTCKGCHNAGVTGGVPGVMMRSFLTDRMGYAVTPVDERPTDDRTPMDHRFGGWYVTGTHTLPHAGNTRGTDLAHEIDQPDRYLGSLDMGGGGNVVSLRDFFEPSFYPVEGSDIVALLVLAHQTRVHNLITIAAKVFGEVRRESALTGAVPAEGLAEALSEAASNRVDYAVQSLVRGMLFYRAEPIGRVEGTSSFASDFATRGPRDPSGRSLRDLSLDDRLFEHPLSFLIYSAAWDALPDLVRERAYAMMHEILTGTDDPDFPLLDDARRGELLEILEATKPDFASFVEALEAGR